MKKITRNPSNDNKLQSEIDNPVMSTDIPIKHLLTANNLLPVNNRTNVSSLSPNVDLINPLSIVSSSLSHTIASGNENSYRLSEQDSNGGGEKQFNFFNKKKQVDIDTEITHPESDNNFKESSTCLSNKKEDT